MRDIKFRGKRIDTGEWIYGHYFKSPLTQENVNCDSKYGWFFLSGETRHCIEHDHVVYEIDPKTLGQYTGLTDKNKKEIYENSTIKTVICNEEYVGVIKYADKWGSFYFATKNENSCGIGFKDVFEWYYEDEEIKAELIEDLTK